MGIADTVEPVSEQLDAIELIEPRTFTITRVDFKENAEQPIAVHLAEVPRPWKPGKNMRRVLMGVWGSDEQAYVGRQLTLFNNPKVKWAGKEVGGVRISHMSHIDKPVNVQVIPSQGQYATYTVKPLPDSPGADDAPVDSVGKPDQVAPASGVDITNDTIAACESIPTLRSWWKGADAATRKVIEKRVKALEEAALG
jgi:hypothetical protein